MLSIAISGLDEVDAKLAAYAAQLVARLAKVSDELAQALVDKVRSDKLSGGVLTSRSGALAASISADIAVDGAGVTASVGSSGVPYAAIQEYGGKTAAHEILPTKAQALAFVAGGALHFARRVNHPGSAIPERSYLRSSLAELGPEIEARLDRNNRRRMERHMSREAAFSALFSVVAAAYPWGLASRRMRLWSETPPNLRPALFQLEAGPETYLWTQSAAPAPHD